MLGSGAQERRRARRAAPSALAVGLPLGCTATLAVWLGTCAVAWWLSGNPIFAGAGLPAAVLLLPGVVGYLYGLSLLAMVHATWGPRGVRCLLVHSDSPVWKKHIHDAWLPRFGERAELLNWSERSKWPRSLAVRVFRHYCGSENFNPAVVVFRGLRHPLVFRFYHAFHQLKAGRSQYLTQLEAELMLAVSEQP